MIRKNINFFEFWKFLIFFFLNKKFGNVLEVWSEIHNIFGCAIRKEYFFLNFGKKFFFLNKRNVTQITRKLFWRSGRKSRQIIGDQNNQSHRKKILAGSKRDWCWLYTVEEEVKRGSTNTTTMLPGVHILLEFERVFWRTCKGEIKRAKKYSCANICEPGVHVLLEFELVFQRSTNERLNAPRRTRRRVSVRRWKESTRRSGFASYSQKSQANW